MCALLKFYFLCQVKASPSINPERMQHQLAKMYLPPELHLDGEQMEFFLDIKRIQRHLSAFRLETLLANLYGTHHRFLGFH
jgi:hypothetical protein